MSKIDATIQLNRWLQVKMNVADCREAVCAFDYGDKPFVATINLLGIKGTFINLHITSTKTYESCLRHTLDFLDKLIDRITLLRSLVQESLINIEHTPIKLANRKSTGLNLEKTDMILSSRNARQDHPLKKLLDNP